MKKILCAAAAIALAASAFAAPKRVMLKVWESDGPEKDFIMTAAREYSYTNQLLLLTLAQKSNLTDLLE